MQENDRKTVDDFLRLNVQKSSHERINSYVLKHIIQRNTQIYMTDAEMQAILDEKGFKVAQGVSWYFGMIRPDVVARYYGKQRIKVRLEIKGSA